MTNSNLVSSLALRERWLTCFEKRPQAQLRLICFAHAGGSASAFAAWHRDLPDTIELCAIKLPGREERRGEPPPSNFGSLATELVEALRAAHDRPVALLGYSLGGLIAFEYARALRRAGLAAPAHLVVAASRAPQLQEHVRIAHLPDREFVREMRARYDGIPHAIFADAELLAYFLPIMRGDLRLFESYRYSDDAPLDCDITALHGLQDPRVSSELSAGWAAQTRGNFELHPQPGGHFFVTPERRRAVLQLLAERIGHSTAKRTSSS